MGDRSQDPILDRIRDAPPDAPIKQHVLANAVATTLTNAEMERVAELDEVSLVRLERLDHVTTMNESVAVIEIRDVWEEFRQAGRVFKGNRRHAVATRLRDVHGRRARSAFALKLITLIQSDQILGMLNVAQMRATLARLAKTATPVGDFSDSQSARTLPRLAKFQWQHGVNGVDRCRIAGPPYCEHVTVAKLARPRKT